MSDDRFLDDPVRAGAVALAAAVRAGEVSARELTATYLARVDGVGAALNAVVCVDAERALAAAGAVDQAVFAGRDPGVLAGVPVTVKEAFAVEGLPTTAGMVELAGCRASADAPAVAALRRAGAVVIGKTNVPRQLADLQCDNPLYGRTHNPWDRSRSPGGSSGGSAAAVAAGLSALDVGSDLSGSIRVPAAWCGVYGLRPSNGLISKRDHLPWPLGGRLEPPTSVVGPLARTVADLALGLAALTATAVSAPEPHDPSRLRLAVWSEVPGAPVDAETAQVLDAARGALAAAGAVTDDLSAPLDPAAALPLAWRLVNAEITYGLAEATWAEAGAAMHQTVRSHLADVEARLRITDSWRAVFDRYDAVLCPATAVAARRHDDKARWDRTVAIDGRDHPFDVLASWSVLASLGHLPSVTFPAGPGAATGLPIGLQLIGPYRGDRRLLAVAAAVDAVIGGWFPPPGW